MPIDGGTEEIAERVRAALESSDLSAFRALLDPDAHWGPPDDPDSGCRTRDEVLAWYQRARDAGVRARVTEIATSSDKVLVGLKVTGVPPAAEQGTEASRWQVLTVRRGRVVDIRGFDARDQAAARAGLTR